MEWAIESGDLAILRMLIGTEDVNFGCLHLYLLRGTINCYFFHILVILFLSSIQEKNYIKTFLNFKKLRLVLSLKLMK